MGKKWLMKLSLQLRLHGNCRGLLHAPKLRHGTDSFTSLPKEGRLRIFSPEKPDSFSRVWTRELAYHQITKATFSTAQTHISLWIQFVLGIISCWCNGVQLINIFCSTWRNAYNITPQKLYVIREGVNFGIIRHTAATAVATRKCTYNVSSTWSKDVFNKFSVIKEMLYAFFWVIHQCP
jgi:hypothetical protein